MYIGLFLILVLLLSIGIVNTNKCYCGFVLLQVLSFFLQFLVGRDCEYDTNTTLFNMLFVNINIFLLLWPWRKISIQRIRPGKRHDIYLQNFRKYLYPLLFLLFFVNLGILVIIYTFMPDIAHLKADNGYKELYEQIPYFASFFRIAGSTCTFGFIAIPLFFYYLLKNNKKEAYKALFLSSSTLVYGFAFYSRALILSYFLAFVFYFFIIEKSLSGYWQRKINSLTKKTGMVIVIGFLIITVVRFSAMDYYGDRIPANSIIKDPVVYSLFDYASQGYNNGINCLEGYQEKNCLNGEYFFSQVYQALSFFGFISWDYDGFEERAAKAFSGNFGLFNGYVASTVCDFGYLGTLLIDILFCVIINRLLYKKKEISLQNLIYILIFVTVMINSIFYNFLFPFIYPLCFLWMLNVMTIIENGLLKRTNIIK